ncbi:Rha family transcriptional regulator [Azotobacter armeniacus]
MSNAITLVQFKGEARVDSRLLAGQLDNQHKASMALIDRYAAKFKRFGVLPFQMEKPTAGSAGGRPERYALMNEDQSYYLLSLSRNTDIVVDLKADLIAAFREARDRANVTDTQYLPLYHAMHDEVAALARRAKECGSSTPERMFHINANKALNAVMGIASGERDTLTIEQRLLLTTLQAVWRNHLHASLECGDDHHEAFRKAKAAVLAYMTGVGALLLGGRAA